MHYISHAHQQTTTIEQHVDALAKLQTNAAGLNVLTGINLQPNMKL